MERANKLVEEIVMILYNAFELDNKGIMQFLKSHLISTKNWNIHINKVYGLMNLYGKIINFWANELNQKGAAAHNSIRLILNWNSLARLFLVE